MKLSENHLYQELRIRDQWTTWQNIKGSKVPNCTVTDPLTFSSFEEVRDSPNKGFVLTVDDPFTVIDLDHCLKATPGGISILPKISDILLKFASYTEISPSGTGLHIWIKGYSGQGIKKSEAEVYSNERYITVTLSPFFNNPIRDCQRELDELISAMGREPDVFPGEKVSSKPIPETPSKTELRLLYTRSKEFRDLWSLKTEYKKADGDPDYSNYDWDLCRILSLWEPDRIAWAIQFFRQKHGWPPKRPGAVAMTIRKQKARL